MTFLKWLVRIHKWVALIVGLQIVLWILGGVVMSAIPIEIVRGEHKIAEHNVQSVAIDEVLPLADAAKTLGATTISSASLGEMLGEPVWRIEMKDAPLQLLTLVAARCCRRLAKNAQKKLRSETTTVQAISILSRSSKRRRPNITNLAPFGGRHLTIVIRQRFMLIH